MDATSYISNLWFGIFPIIFFLQPRQVTLREKCPYLELLWSTFSRIWTEYGEIRRAPYLVRMPENTDQNNAEYGHFLCSVTDQTVFRPES